MSEKRDHNDTIIIAEDSLTQGEHIKSILEESGYTVIHCLNGKEALIQAQKVKPMMIISDIIMPEIDGYEFCKQVKSDNNLNQTPVILLTSLTDIEDVLQGLDCGADSYVMKPFEKDHLLSRIDSLVEHKHLLEKKKSKQENVDLLFSGKKLQLSSNRFQILNMLLSTYEGAVQKTHKLKETQATLAGLRSSLTKKVEEKTKDLQSKINERIEIESAIKESEQKYRDLVENATVGIFSSTFDDRLLFVNKAFRNILNFDSEEKLMSYSFSSLCETSKDYKNLIDSLKKNSVIQNFEIKMIPFSGDSRWVMLNATREGTSFSGMIRDIDGRKKTEEKAKRYLEKLNAAKNMAEESDRLKTAFLSNMSHEIRTPMNAIIGFSSLVADTGLSSENRSDFVDRISSGCYNLLTLIDNILDIAKLEAGQIRLKREKCVLNSLLEDIYSVFENEISATKKDELSFQLQKGNKNKDFTIYTDQIRIQQVLSNLLDNAFKYTEGGSIDFGYSVMENTIQFFVKDTGIGLENEQKEYIFERFRKAENIKSKLYGGAGLGLAICKKLISIMDGKIWLETKPGIGTTFFFTVPLKIAEKPVEKPEKIVPAPKVESIKGKQILVAEDNMINYKLIEAILSKTEANIAWAKDGVEAVELCKSDRKFDLILMDIRMPNMDGIQATREIKKLEKDLPVIAVTAYGLGEVEELARQREFDGYVTKPVNPTKLLEIMMINFK